MKLFYTSLLIYSLSSCSKKPSQDHIDPAPDTTTESSTRPEDQDNSLDQSEEPFECIETELFADSDNDSFGDPNESKIFCTGEDTSGYVSNADDQCLGEDDKLIETLYEDLDGDGFGNPASMQQFCPGEDKEGYVANGRDLCLGEDDKFITTLYSDEDGDGLGDPSLAKDFCPNANTQGFVSNDDDQCVGDDDSLIQTLYSDADGDGLGDPNSSQFFCPSANKMGFVDNKDDKCLVDDDSLIATFYADGDGDGFGDPNNFKEFCPSASKQGFVPNADERCLGDNDALIETLYSDADGDGLGDASNFKIFCPSANKQGFVPNSNDRCVGDNDALIVILYADADGDGLGDLNSPQQFCPSANKQGFVANADDRCLGDDDALINIFYSDADGDGLGDPNNSMEFCPSQSKEGFVPNADDRCVGDNDNLIETLYSDEDGDGLGDPNKLEQFCPSASKEGFVPNADDRCVGDDDNLIETLYSDADGDGLGDPSYFQEFCPSANKQGFVANSDDKCVGDDDKFIEILYSDADEDGLGDPNNFKEFCPSASKLGFVGNGNDQCIGQNDFDLVDPSDPKYCSNPLYSIWLANGIPFVAQVNQELSNRILKVAGAASYSLTDYTSCLWMDIDFSTGILSGMPLEEDMGTCLFEVQASSPSGDYRSKSKVDVSPQNSFDSKFNVSMNPLPQDLTTSSCNSETSLDINLSRPDAIYGENEPIEFNIAVTRNGPSVAEGSILIEFRADGDELLSSSTYKLDGSTLVFSVMAQKPTVMTIIASYEGQCPSASINKTISYAHTAVKVAYSRPQDFASYWQDQVRASLDKNLSSTVTKYLPENYSHDYGETYRVLLQDDDGLTVYGELCVPTSTGDSETVPAILELPSAGVYNLGFTGYCNNYLGTGKSVMLLRMNAHDLPFDSSSSQMESLGNYPFSGYESRDTYYFRKVFLRMVQSLRFLKAHPKFDGTNLFTAGKSQGGGLAIIAAGLDPDVKAVAASVPALSDHRSYLLGGPGGWPFLNNYNVNQYEQLAGTMAYYDSAYFAELTSAPVTMGVGLLDKTTPPTSSFATFNSFPTSDKELHIDANSGHNGVENWFSIVTDFLSRHVVEVP